MADTTEPKNLVTVTKQLAGGTEQITVAFNIPNLDDLQEGVDKAYKTIDARADVIKAEMKKIEDEMRAKMDAAKEAK